MTLARMVECIPPDVCEKIIAAAEATSFNRATVISQGGMDVDEIRSNYTCPIPPEFKDAVYAYLNQAIEKWSAIFAEEEYANVLYLPGITSDFNTVFEPPSLLRYENNQEYKWHCDGKPFINPNDTALSHNRLISIVCYLNDNFEGGETKVLNTPWKPVRGKALVFPSNWTYPHCACPVTLGTKYSIATWYHAAY